MGRGGNARFHNFQLDHYGPTDGQTDQRTDKAVSATKNTETERSELDTVKVADDWAGAVLFCYKITELQYFTLTYLTIPYNLWSKKYIV